MRGAALVDLCVREHGGFVEKSEDRKDRLVSTSPSGASDTLEEN